nr:hypothetical protein [Sphingobium yanoikuyae]
MATMGHEEKYLLIGNVVARHRKPIVPCSMSVPIPPPAAAPTNPRKKGKEDRHRLSGPLSGRGSAPPYDQPRQPILPAIIVAAQPATVVVAAHLATSPEDAAKDTAGKAAERGIAARRYIIARDNGIFDDSWEVMWKLRFGGSL